MFKNSIIPFKLPLLILLGSLTAFVSYRMWNLPLWSHLPLAFFIGFWGFIIIALADRYSSLPQNGKLLLLSTLSGLLLGFGFPVSPMTPLMFIGFVPLLMVEKEISDSRTAISKWEVFKYSYHAFVVWNIIATYWVANAASFAASFIAIWLNSAFMTIPFILFHVTKKVMPRNFMYIAFIANWMVWEYIHLRWEVSWPWLTLGNSFAQYPSWVQWYEYTGVFGGTFWILFSNVLVYNWIARPRWQEGIAIQTINLVKITGLILIPIFISFWLYSAHQEKGRAVEVVVVQPNYEPHYQKFRVSPFEVLDRFIELSKSQLTANTEYLVFPETSFNRIDKDRMNRIEIIRKLQALLNEYPNLKLVMGIDAYKIFREEIPDRSTIRKQVDKKSGRVTHWESYNAAIQMESGNKDIQFYKKGRFVPGAEIFPYSSLLFFVGPIVDKLGGTVAGLGSQPLRTPFESDSGKVGAAICYESIYGEFYAGYVRHGADAVFIITNDGWWDDTPGYKQHLKFASLRAIETRRAIARSANTGTSAFLNQRGDILQPTAYEEATAIKEKIQFNDEITFYVQWGDILGRVAIFTSILLLLNTFVKGRMKQ